ncbi:MAG: LPS export ABC transporter permease LptF [Pseudomonadota bacterium]
MNRLDRYIFIQLLGPFGFFALIFTGVIWLSQSLRIIDLVVNNGQSAAIFAEFTALLLPVVMSIVLPVSAFAATLFTLNRLRGDSELVVMMGAGFSYTRLARPVFAFGLVNVLAMAVVTLYLMPTAAGQLRDRMADVTGDIAAALIRAGQFVHPTAGLTVYVAEASNRGEMAGIFIHDRRDPETPVTYSANRAALLRDALSTRVVMFDGAAQHFDRAAMALSTLRFESFTYDLTPLMQADPNRRKKPSEYYVATLIDPPQALRDEPYFHLGDYVAEGHEQLSAPLYGLALPLIAFGFVLFGGFGRRGAALIVWAAIGCALSLRLTGVAAKALTTDAAGLWPSMYIPPLLVLLAFVALMIRPAAGRVDPTIPGPPSDPDHPGSYIGGKA